MTATLNDDAELCPQCGHLYAPHLMIATGEQATEGGVMICNVEGCKCYSTWDVPPFSSRLTIRVPSQGDLDALREELQG